MPANEGNTLANSINKSITTITSAKAYGFIGAWVWEKISLASAVTAASKIKKTTKDVLRNKRRGVKSGNSASTMIIGTAMLNTAWKTVMFNAQMTFISPHLP